jgi:hypothetical protein
MTSTAKVEAASGAARDVRGFLRFALLLGVVLSGAAGAATGQLAVVSMALGCLSFAVVLGVCGASVIMPESTAPLGKRVRGRLLNLCLGMAVVWLAFMVVGFVREELGLWFTLAAIGPLASAIWCVGAVSRSA